MPIEQQPRTDTGAPTPAAETRQDNPDVPNEVQSAEQAEPQFRTIAVRVHTDQHAKLSFIAQLRKSSISDEIRAAIELRIARAQDDPDLIARAQATREQIEREAAARAAAIAGFMGQHATAQSQSTSTRRRANSRNQ